MKENSAKASKRFTNIPLPQTVVHYCEQFKVQHIVISAGSRNAPLTNGFVENLYFKTYSVVDERAAAFFGLGMAQQLKQPVALVCTSGSALLNYYPAVAEAYYSSIPLLIISADRMPHRIDIGDGQTIQQEGVFGPHLVGRSHLKPDVSHATDTLLESPLQTLLPQNADYKLVATIQDTHQQHNQAELHRVISLAIQKQGPVHLNVPMEEPLYGMSDLALDLPPVLLDEKPIEPLHFDALQKDWIQASKIMILVGVMAPDAENETLFDSLLKDPRIVLLTEKTSNINHPSAIHSIDCLMAPMELDNERFEKVFQPDLLISMGGMIVSKKIKAFLRKYPAKKHYHLDPLNAYDTFYYLNQHIKAPAITVLKSLIELVHNTVQADYQERVLHQYKSYLSRGESYLKRLPFSDLKVFSILFKKLPNSIHLQIANSSPIRYAQLFSLPKSITVNCNRGTSGIDGSTATAVGAAQIQRVPTLLITGDLSFFYDSNGLWNNYIPKDFRIIIINNQGGGIFRILPGEKDSTKYDTYFETIHQRSGRDLARTYGFSYRNVRSIIGLQWALKFFFKTSQRPKILEIQTPRKINDTILLNYFKAMVK